VLVSRRTKQFRKLFDDLPADVQRQARADYQLFKQNPQHPSLEFKPVLTAGTNAWSAKIGDRYRVIGYRAGEVIVWDWIGTHEAYNRIVKQRR
jgi:mRNA-degrading endonuclease RelE of RelBE toxin-antitoxin system